LLDIVEF
jgi:hypothetical protein